MTSSVYQATVTALEALLPPRVVSRALQEGLQALTKTPATLQYADVDKILKAQVYRQLQVFMPVTEAKTKLQHILETLKKVDETAQSAAPTEDASAREEALGALRASLKPFNLYFEWPEVQKLRAQLQLLESEHEAGRDTARLVEEARQGLATVEQKLTDQLVYQAKALSELTAAFEVVQSLDSPKIRRLENLMSQIQMAQQARSLAPAEVERAYKLMADLRKLAESTVVEPTVAESSVVVETSPVSPDDEGLIEPESEADDLLSVEQAGAEQTGVEQVGAEQVGREQGTEERPATASATLLRTDLDDERRSLDKLAADFADLLNYRPALAAQLAAHKAQLATGTSLAVAAEQLRADFAAAAVAERAALSQEFTTMQAALSAWAAADENAGNTGASNPDAGNPGGNMNGVSDTTELAQHFQVTLSVLANALPPLRDVQHLRSLYHLAQNGYDATRQRDAAAVGEAGKLRRARLAEQLGELHRLEERVSGYGGVTLPELQTLSLHLQQARTQLENEKPLDTLADLWALLSTVQTLLEQRATDFGGRLDAALQIFDEVAKLNSEEVGRVGVLLHHLDSQREAFEQVSAKVRDDLVGSLAEAETLLSELQTQYGATRAVADQLIGSAALEGLFGFFEPAQPAAPSSLESWVTDQWVAERCAEDGVQGVFLFDPQGRVLSARGQADAQRLYPALAKFGHSAAELGEGLLLGEVGVSVIELAGTALVSTLVVSTAGEPSYRLALLVEPARLDYLLDDFRSRLADLHDLLVQS